MIYLLIGIGTLCLFNLILLMLVAMNIIQLREVVEGFMESPPIDRRPQDDAGLSDVATSQLSYSTEPLIEE